MRAVLTGDGTITGIVGPRVYSYEAPGGTAYPCIVFAALTGEDVTPIGGLRLLSDFDYIIHAIDETGSVLDLEALALRIDALLQNQQYVASGGGTILSCIRTRVIPMVETFQGRQYRHLNQTYHVQVQGG